MSQVPQWILMALVLLGVIIAGVLISGKMTSTAAQTAQTTQTASVSTNLEKIQNAMSAAPFAIAQNATILDWPASPGASPRQLRAGFNGWTCLPDEPSTPINDPMCADEIFMSMLQAFMEGRPFTTQEIGWGYMLQGGAAASNTDPFKTAPGPGEQWLIDGSHIMLVGPESALSKHTGDHSHGGPYVMWQGTPYAHVMIPTTR